MCKQRIESALDYAGIKMAQWDPKTENLELVYNANKISAQKIHALIAGVGLIQTLLTESITAQKVIGLVV